MVKGRHDAALWIVCAVAAALLAANLALFSSGAALPFVDNFDDRRSGWDVYRTGMGGYNYRDGEFAFWISRGGPLLWLAWSPLSEPRPETLVVEAAAYALSGGDRASYGVIFGLDMANYYAFEVRADGAYRVFCHQAGESLCEPGIWTRPGSAASGSAADRLRVVITGDRAALEVNGLELGTISLAALKGPYRVGICGGCEDSGPAEVRFTQFAVSIPSEAELAAAEAAPPVYPVCSALQQDVLATATDAAGDASAFSADLFYTSLPEWKGEKYTARIPDTLDLQERAALLINAFTHCTNPRADYAVYQYIDFSRNPPVMTSQFAYSGDSAYSGKFVEGLLLMRRVTGSAIDSYVDVAWRRWILNAVASDSWNNEFGGRSLHGIDGGRILAWLADNYEVERDDRWMLIIQRALAQLASEVVWNGDSCYFPDGSGRMPTGWDATLGGWTLQGLTRVYVVTRSEEARRLAAGLASYLRYRAAVFDTDGHFLARQGPELRNSLHFHHNANALVSLAEYALAVGDRELAGFVNKGYQWARSLGSSLVGFFPEYVDHPPDDRTELTCETCCTADMILLALNLTVIGAADYWDDIDRFLRNQFGEMQMIDSEWVARLTQAAPRGPVAPGESSENVAERAVGSFASWASLNDLYGFEAPGGPAFTSCCTGNAARVIWFVWENMLSLDGETLRVNLLLNRASPWADIISYIPYAGRVEVSVKQACKLEFRLPEWVSGSDLTCKVGEEKRTLQVEGRCASVGRVEAGQVLTIQFPIAERTVNAKIGSRSYKLVFKGNDLVNVSPRGKWCPLYQRDRFRSSSAQWTTVERFVPNPSE